MDHRAARQVQEFLLSREASGVSQAPGTSAAVLATAGAQLDSGRLVVTRVEPNLGFAAARRTAATTPERPFLSGKGSLTAPASAKSGDRRSAELAYAEPPEPGDAPPDSATPPPASGLPPELAWAEQRRSGAPMPSP